MAAIILLPADNGGLPQANIYRSDTIDGAYSLIDTIPVEQKEYEDTAGDHTKYYTVAFTDGNTEAEQVRVNSHIQNIIEVVRREVKVDSTELSDSDIEYLANSVRLDVMSDICSYGYEVKLSKLEQDTYYELPNRFFFDANFGGSVSTLDIEVYTQEVPTYRYTEKVPVTPVRFNPKDRFIEIPEPIGDGKVLKLNYFYTSREIRYNNLQKLLAFKICSVFYQQQYMQLKDSDVASVKIGDVTVNNHKAASIALDIYQKMNAKYDDLKRRMIAGFYRVK